MRVVTSSFYVLKQLVAHHITVSMEHLPLIYGPDASPSEAGGKTFLHADGS